MNHNSDNFDNTNEYVRDVSEELGIPGVVEVIKDIPPENVKLIGVSKMVDPNAKVGVSLHQDFEAMLQELMPEYSWQSTWEGSDFFGKATDERFTVDIYLGIKPWESKSHIVKDWETVATSFIWSPSMARKMLNLPEPDGPLGPEDDLTKPIRSLSIHLWPPDSELKSEQNKQARAIGGIVKEEHKTVKFLSEKVFNDTDGRCIVALRQLEEELCGNREKLLDIFEWIKTLAKNADASVAA